MNTELPFVEFSQRAESAHGPTTAIPGTKWHEGNQSDGRHYWLTPPALMRALQAEFDFDFDPCPYPVPPNFDGLSAEWGKSNYVNPPFGTIIHDGKKKGPTAWARKSIAEAAKGKRVVMVYPIDKWVLLMLSAGAVVRNLGDVRWCATEDGLQGPGTGRHVAAFILEPSPAEPNAVILQPPLSCSDEPEKEPEAGRPTGFGPAIGSPKLPARGPTDPSASRSPNGAEGRPQASEASVWVNDGDMARLPAQQNSEGKPQDV